MANRWGFLVVSGFLLFPVSYCSDYPIESRLNQYLPNLGSSVGNLPEWIQQDRYDPSAQIVCLGPLPDTHVPKEIILDQELVTQSGFPHHPRDSYESHYTNLRSLCAKAAYGGSVTMFNAGGFCATTTYPPTILFEHIPPNPQQMSDEIKRLFLFCQHSCRCVVGDYADLQNQGRPAQQILDQEANPLEPFPVPPNSVALLDPISSRPALWVAGTMPPASSQQMAIPIYFLSEVAARRLGRTASITGSGAVTTVWIPAFASLRSPVCHGTISVVHFGTYDQDAQKVCAATWYGGSESGNVGVACGKISLDSTGYELGVYEESVQHPAYRMNRDSVYGRTRRQCRHHCSCGSPRNDPDVDATPSEADTIDSSDFDSYDYDSSDERIDMLRDPSTDQASGDGVSSNPYPMVWYGPFSPTYFRRRRRRDQQLGKLCSSNKVEGFGLGESLALQRLCQTGNRMGL